VAARIVYVAGQGVTACSEEVQRILLTAVEEATPHPELAVVIFYLEVREATI
jgi:hypothetical protein